MQPFPCLWGSYVAYFMLSASNVLKLNLFAAFLNFTFSKMIFMWQTIPADKNLRAGDWGWTEGKHFVNRVPQVENGSETSSASLLGVAEWQDCTGSWLRQGGNPRGSRLLWPRPQGGRGARLHPEGVHRGRRG